MASPFPNYGIGLATVVIFHFNLIKSKSYLDKLEHEINPAQLKCFFLNYVIILNGIRIRSSNMKSLGYQISWYYMSYEQISYEYSENASMLFMTDEKIS